MSNCRNQWKRTVWDHCLNSKNAVNKQIRKKFYVIFSALLDEMVEVTDKKPPKSRWIEDQNNTRIVMSLGAAALFYFPFLVSVRANRNKF